MPEPRSGASTEPGFAHEPAAGVFNNIVRALRLQPGAVHDEAMTQDSPMADQLLGSLRSAADAESRGVIGPEAAKALRQTLESLKTNSRPRSDILLILAYASRQDSWRAPLGEAGCIQFALDNLDCADRETDQKHHSMRLLGNVCADHDDNRERLLELKGLSKMMVAFDRDSQSSAELTILAVFNVCCDNEKAQKALYEQGAFPILDGILRHQWSPPASFVSYACQMLGMAPNHGKCISPYLDCSGSSEKFQQSLSKGCLREAGILHLHPALANSNLCIAAANKKGLWLTQKPLAPVAGNLLWQDLALQVVHRVQIGGIITMVFLLIAEVLSKPQNLDLFSSAKDHLKGAQWLEVTLHEHH